jgi:hypothetical protein
MGLQDQVKSYSNTKVDYKNQKMRERNIRKSYCIATGYIDHQHYIAWSVVVCAFLRVPSRFHPVRVDA